MSIPEKKPISLQAKEIACQIEQYCQFIEDLDAQETKSLVAYLRQAHDKLLNAVEASDNSQDQASVNVTLPLMGELKQKIEALQADANASTVGNNDSPTQIDVPEKQDINSAVLHIQEAYKEFTRIKNFVTTWTMHFQTNA